MWVMVVVNSVTGEIEEAERLWWTDGEEEMNGGCCVCVLSITKQTEREIGEDSGREKRLVERN